MAEVWFFIKYLYQNAGKSLSVAFVGMVIISLLEGIGVLLLLPMLSLGGVIESSSEGASLSQFLWFLPDLSKSSSLTVILAIFVLIAVLQNVLQRYITVRNLQIQQNYTARLRSEIYGELLYAGWDLFTRKRKADLIHAMTDDLGRITVGVIVTIQFLAAIVFTIIQLGVAFMLSPELTTMIAACGIALTFFSRKLVKRSRQLGGRLSEISRSYLAGITDQLNGIKEIKSNSLERSRLTWLRETNRKLNEENLSFTRLNATSQLIYKISAAVFIAAFIWLYYRYFHAEPGQILLIIFIFSRLWPRFTGIQSNLQQIASASPPLRSLIQLRREFKKAQEIDDLDYAGEQVKTGLSIQHQIEFRDVDFGYPSAETGYALKQVNVQIPVNRMTAIVGKSGAGKSTFIDLLMGLLQPVQGTIFLDDIPLTKRHLLYWRNSISYVPQEPFLFNGSIRDNLLLMLPDASDERIWEALETASLSEFVSRLPQGLDTELGDRGIRLSGGERQRLVMARALLRRPSVLVLDEATSALDTENEKNIQEALGRMKGKMTIIVVAHRLNTIRNADQVIVFDQGSIVQTGQFQQLASEKKGLFRTLLGQPADVG